MICVVRRVLQSALQSIQAGDAPVTGSKASRVCLCVCVCVCVCHTQGQVIQVAPSDLIRPGLPMWTAVTQTVMRTEQVEEAHGPRPLYTQQEAVLLLTQGATWKVRVLRHAQVRIGVGIHIHTGTQTHTYTGAVCVAIREYTGALRPIVHSRCMFWRVCVCVCVRLCVCVCVCVHVQEAIYAENAEAREQAFGGMDVDKTEKETLGITAEIRRYVTHTHKHTHTDTLSLSACYTKTRGRTKAMFEARVSHVSQPSSAPSAYHPVTVRTCMCNHACVPMCACREMEPKYMHCAFLCVYMYVSTRL